MVTRREKWQLGAVYLLLFFCYTLYVFYVHQPWNSIYSDMQGYIERARNLAAGIPLAPYDSFYPIGTTYLFAPFFAIFKYNYALRLIGVFQAALLAGNAVLVYLIVKRFFRISWISWLALGAVACYYPFIIYIGFYLSEVAFSFFLLLSVYLFHLCFSEKKASTITLLATGLFLGIATITKGTLYPTLLGLIIIAYFGYSRTWNWAKLGYIAAGFGVYLLLQLAHSQLSTGKMSLLPSNGGLSAYLGQMHVRSVTNRTNGGYTIFYNNNSYYDKTLTKDVVFYTPVWDQKPFIDAVITQWKHYPAKQISISINNMIDLYRPVAHWPARNDSRTIPYDLAFQYVYIVLVYPLFVIGIVRSVITKDKLPEWAILLVLVVGVTITAGVTKGEERYLIPFSYYYFIGAAGALGRLANKRWG